jgi:hypothetical protein
MQGLGQQAEQMADGLTSEKPSRRALLGFYSRFLLIVWTKGTFV